MSYFDIKIQVMNGEYIKIFKYAYRLEKYIVSISKEMRKLRTQEDSFSDIISSLHDIIEEIKFEDNDKEFKDKIIDNELDKLDNLGLGLEWFKYKAKQYGLLSEANMYHMMNEQGITYFTARELQIGKKSNEAGQMAFAVMAGEVAMGSIAKVISSGTKVENVGVEESVLSTETGEIVKLSSSNIQHIKKHSFEGLKEQAKYLDDAKLAKKIVGNTFFNPKWSQEQIVSNTEKAYNALISEGKTGLQSFNIDGEDIYIFIKSDGTFDTAYGTHILTVKDFR